MGIVAEYNPDLCLRNFEEFSSGRRCAEECVPKLLEVNKTFPFLKKGQRHYWLEGEIPLRMTDGKQLSKPIASIRITQATHFLKEGVVYTRGEYKVMEVYDPKESTIHFDGLEKIK